MKVNDAFGAGRQTDVYIDQTALRSLREGHSGFDLKLLAWNVGRDFWDTPIRTP